MKNLILIITFIGTFGHAHDEGHGPKLGDQPKYGGKIAAVIDKKEINKGAKATMLYKAELTKNNDNLVRVYLYDKKMKLTDIGPFKNAAGELQFEERKTKKWKSQKISFTKKENFYESLLPKNLRKPFNIDISLTSEDKTLFMAFDNLN